MKECLLALSVCFLFQLKVRAQEQPEYAAARITDSLRSYAGAVIRASDQTIEIKDIFHVVYRQKIVTTILNASGKENALLSLYYNNSNQIKNLEGAIYNDQGELIEKIREADFKDISAAGGFSFFVDTRQKVYTPHYSNYPFTICYTYEISDKNSIAFPTWYPQQSAGIALEHSTLKIIAPENFPLRFEEFRWKGIKRENKSGKNRIFEWHATGLKAFREEGFSLPLERILCSIKIAPVRFGYEGKEGSFYNWETYGKWTCAHLLKGQDVLPAAAINKIIELVREASSVQEKIKRIYEYVQNKTRYVSIRKGIGGLQPMAAEKVDALGYGDCKALTNYTMALLKAVGIPSFYAEIYSGREERHISKDFASLQGDHVVLCIPFSKDTIWLECTSKTAPMGYLGITAGNRNAILCTPEGGFIVNTKNYSTADNKIITAGNFSIDSTGAIQGSVTHAFYGIYYNDRQNLVESSSHNKKNKIFEIYTINNLQVHNYVLRQDKSGTPFTSETLDCLIPAYCIRRNERLLLPFNAFPDSQGLPEDAANRQNEVFIGRGFTKEIEMRYKVPQNLIVDFLPKKKEIHNSMGTFEFSAGREGDTLVFRRFWSLNQGTYTAGSYQQLLEFFKEADFSNSLKAVLLRKN